MLKLPAPTLCLLQQILSLPTLCMFAAGCSCPVRPCYQSCSLWRMLSLGCARPSSLSPLTHQWEALRWAQPARGCNQCKMHSIAGIS